MPDLTGRLKDMVLSRISRTAPPTHLAYGGTRGVFFGRSCGRGLEGFPKARSRSQVAGDRDIAGPRL